MPTQYIAGYKFTALNDLDHLQNHFVDCCRKLSLKGTILLSAEGININLAGAPVAIADFINALKLDSRFIDLPFHISYTDTPPFKRLKVKLKKEIITLRQPMVKPVEQRAPSIKPTEFKKWLDEKRDITILDTRNDYEIKVGTFSNAVSLGLNDFVDFSTATDKIDRHKPIVMFCTGGIRCEKAALHLLNEGFSDVFQLDGGILGYFKTVGNAHYHGDCFVFDDRVALDSNLNITNNGAA